MAVYYEDVMEMLTPGVEEIFKNDPDRLRREMRVIRQIASLGSRRPTHVTPMIEIVGDSDFEWP